MNCAEHINWQILIMQLALQLASRVLSATPREHILISINMN